MDQKPEDGEEESGGEELRSAHDAQLRRDGFDDREAGAGRSELQGEKGDGEGQAEGPDVGRRFPKGRRARSRCRHS